MPQTPLVRSVDEIVARMRTSAEDRQLTFRCRYTTAVPATFEGDAARLQQVLLALLANAIEFTTAGRVSVEVGFQPTSSSEGFLLIEIVDSGTGVDEAMLARWFNPVSDTPSPTIVDDPRCARFARSRQIVNEMGGDIAVQFTLGQDTVTTVWFPIEVGRDGLVGPSDDPRQVVSPPKVSKNHAAYVGWLRSRFAHIEHLSRDGRTAELIETARELRESASRMGFDEIAEAAGVLQRGSVTSSETAEAALEILRRIVVRLVRKVKATAA